MSIAVAKQPFGIVNLLAKTDLINPIGNINNHPWLNPLVDGMRARPGWSEFNPTSGTYQWAGLDGLGGLDAYVTLSQQSGKWFGVGVVMGIDPPAWVKAGSRNKDLTGGDLGQNMCVPWDPFYKAAVQTFVRALGARYDSSPYLRYVNITGTQQTGELYIAGGAGAGSDGEWFIQDALDHGYVANNTLGFSAGTVAWLETIKENIAVWAEAFPTTMLILTGAKPLVTDGTAAYSNLVNWVETGIHKGHIGYMWSQLNIISSNTSFNIAPGYDNYATTSGGGQFLQTCGNLQNIQRCCQSAGYGPYPTYSGQATLAGVMQSAVRNRLQYVETYESDIEKSDFTSTIAAYRPAFRNPRAPGGNIALRASSGGAASQTEVFAYNVENVTPPGIGTDLRWDRYVPTTGGPTWPAVVVLHVGGYSNGSRGPVNVCQDLAAAGFLVFAAEYRLVSPATDMINGGPPGNGQQFPTPSNGQPPQQTNDVLTAVLAARNDAQCNGIVGIVGGSTGGAHGLWNAKAGTPSGNRANAVACLSPVCDLANVTDLNDTARPSFKSNVYNYIGLDSNVYSVTSNTFQTAAKNASPYWLGSYATAAPTLVIHSTSDTIPANQHSTMVTKLTSDGATFEQILRDTGSTAPNTSHHAFQYWDGGLTGSATYPTIKEYIINFLQRKLNGA